MVFFICNHCGESVKKPAVEKHYNTKCRGAAKNVSCMDCLKDFYNEEYVAHTKCISEAQKYSGKDFVQKESQNSGAKKQESWMDIIRAILDSSDYKLSAQARSAFERLRNVDNVPRKKEKFQNFVKNGMHMRMRTVEEVWGVLEKEQEKMKLAKQQQSAAANAKANDKPVENGVKREATEENGHEEPVKKKSKKEKKAENTELQQTNTESEANLENMAKKSKKKKIVPEDEVVTSTETYENSEATGKKAKKRKAEQEGVVVQMPSNDSILEASTEDANNFEWSAVLEKIVRKNAEGITLEKLKKRVLKRYSSKIGAEEMTEKQIKKFEKKFIKNLKKSTAMHVEGDIVKAC